MTEEPTQVPLSFPPDPGARRSLCKQGHAALKASDKHWESLPFASIFPFGGQLFEGRHCARCNNTTILRPVSLARALELLLGELTTRAIEPRMVKAAFLLLEWVTLNVPATMGVVLPSATREATPHVRSR